MRQKAEILAPVGGSEQLIAAVRCGANAVYLGGKGFNARRNAENFTQTTLADAVSYCHARGVRVHVTVNTLILDGETDALEEEARYIAESGADAVIIQDMAVLRLFRDRCPGMELHASTQAVVHNADGARAMRDLGFHRVVLARELSLREIEKVANAVDIELEAFIHGALCTSLSGACYLSAMLGGRSGNRGLCAQPCRLDFRSGSTPYALSLKDMSHIPHILDMQSAGVTSFKIEGRMKRPEYVAAAVTACRQALNAEAYDLETLRKVFSRGGFTDGYLLGRRGPEMRGTRTKEDAEASGEVLGSLRQLYRAERPAVPVDMKLTVRRDMPVSLAALCGDSRIEVSAGIPEPARSAPLSAERARDALSKTGGTPFCLRELDADIAPDLSVSAGRINGLRREALDALLKEREKPRPKKILPGETVAVAHIAGEPTLRARFETAEQIMKPELYERISLPVEEIAREPEWIGRLGDTLVGEIPPALFPEDEDALYATVEDLKSKGLKALYCDNVYGVPFAKRLGLPLDGGFGLNVTNSEAIAEYESMGLRSLTVSFEVNAQAIRALGGTISRGAIGYGYLPLMRLRRCPNRKEAGCGDCDGQPKLIDRMGVEFPLLCHGRKYTTLLNSVPLYTGDRPLKGVDFTTLYFTIESAEEALRVTRAYQNADASPVPRTNGLYGRALL